MIVACWVLNNCETGKERAQTGLRNVAFAVPFMSGVPRKLQRRNYRCSESNLKCAVLEMRVGPSNSECRLGVQTANCCAGPRASVVNEFGKGGTRSRQVSDEETNASEPLITCRKTLAVIKTSCAEYSWDQLGGSLLTAQVVAGIKAA